MSRVFEHAGLPTTVPEIDPGSAPFWEGLGSDRLVLPRCPVDGELVWVPRPFCPRHADAGVVWVDVAGGGTVYSYTVVHRGEGLFAGQPPFVLAYVDLDEGPRVLTNLVGDESRLAVGARVEAIIQRGDAGPGVLRFTLCGEK